MTARVERILTKLAQKHAFHLLHNLPADNTRLQILADGLARLGVLVMTADIARNNTDAVVNQWVALYGDFFRLLAENLFPMFKDVKATYADNQHPPVVVIEGRATVVIEVMAGYIVPYIALKQHDKLLSEAELNGVMFIILGELEAGDLPREKYNRLVTEGTQILQTLLQLPFKHVALTSFARPMFQQLQQKGETPPPKPPPIPETPPDEPLTETGKMFSVRIPLHPLKGRRNKSERRPPVPLPKPPRKDD